MATSLTNSPIPAYDPNNSHVEPKVAPRVNGKGTENYMKGRGQMSKVFTQETSITCESPRPQLKHKYEDAQNNLIKNQGSMKSCLTGYLDMPLDEKKGPRVKKEAFENARRSQGTVSSICFKDYGKPDEKCGSAVSKNQLAESVDMHERSRGGGGGSSVGELLGNYGQLAQSTRRQPRVKPEAKSNADREGSEIFKTLTMQPPTERVRSAYKLTNSIY